MRTEIFIQARMGSIRLPGKVLREVSGRPLLSYQIERLNRCIESDRSVILTTTEPKDDLIIDFCKKEKIDYFRGSELDVLSRYFHAAQARNVDLIVRITADCPLIDPTLVDETIHFFKKDPKHFDYVSNVLVRTWPRGLDVEVFNKKTLEITYFKAKKLYEREHVTPYIYHHPEEFHLGNVTSKKDLSQYNLSVDTLTDFELVKNILENLYSINPKFTTEDIIKYLNK